MRIFRFAAVCCLISLFAVLPPETAGRCAVTSVETAYKDSKAVFIGEVLSVVKDDDVKPLLFGSKNTGKARRRK